MTGHVTFNLGDVSGSNYGKNNGTTANFGASTPDPSTITYTSAVLHFSGTGERNFNDSIVSLTQHLDVNGTNHKFNDFIGTASGLFSSDPPPIVTTSLPEAASWITMLAGFGVVAQQCAQAVAASTSSPPDFREARKRVSGYDDPGSRCTAFCRGVAANLSFAGRRVASDSVHSRSWRRLRLSCGVGRRR